MDKAKIEIFRGRHIAMKAELEGLQQISRGETATVMLDQQSVGRLSRMDALQRQAMGAEQARRRGHDLQRIAAALQRISDGEFGSCIHCGEDIAEGRLDFDPAITSCVQCARSSG